MVRSIVKNGLEQCVTNGKCEFMTYGEFSSKFDLGDNSRIWANRDVLDDVSINCKNDVKIKLDLTFLLRNKNTLYPSVIDGQRYDPDNPGKQIVRARAEAQRIIDKYCPGTKNPY